MGGPKRQRNAVGEDSKEGSEEAADVFEVVVEDGAAGEGGEVDGGAAVEVVEHHQFEAGGEGGVVDGDAGLVVGMEAAVVPVGGADHRHAVVDGQGLGMDEGRFAFVDAHAGFEEVFVEGAGGPGGVDVVAAAREDDVGADAAQGRETQGPQEVVGGQEVGGDEEDALAGGVDGAEEEVGGEAFGGGGAGGDDAGEGGADGRKLAEVVGGEEGGRVFAGHDVPVAEEGVLEFLDDGAAEAEVVVLDPTADREVHPGDRRPD